MKQPGHLDSLSAVDASFLHQEGRSTHMHIGAVALFEGPPPEFTALEEHVAARLHLVPRYRQKLATPPGGIGRQRWIDDPHFRLEYHLRHVALPAPGNQGTLRNLVARIFSQQLDRTKPLWEMYVVVGLADDAWALLSKTHHSLVDGVSGVDLTTILFDLDPEGRDVEPQPWVPHPEPTGAELAAATLGSAARRTARLALRGVGAAADPAGSAGALRETAENIGVVARQVLRGAPESPLNVPIGPHRRITWTITDLAALKAIKNAHGGTVNDVVLAAVAGGVRDWLRERGHPVKGLGLRACVPVSTRGEADGTLGNRITQLVAPLPVEIADPVRRLRRVSAAMAGIKESRQAAGAEMIAGMQDFAPPTVLARASRLNFSTRVYNVLVTNVPGPQFPLYVLGRRMEVVIPVAFLAGDRALATAVMSYDGTLAFGLIADRDTMPDIDVVARGIEQALHDMAAATATVARA